jgi:hypothetical protein
MTDIDVQTTRDWIAAIVTGTNTVKGRGLEDLVQTVFSAVPGLELATPRKRNLKNTAEIDLAFRVRTASPIESFGRALVLECKNQGKKISAEQVMRFAGKIEDAHLPGGVLVTLTPVSGSDEPLAAARAELDKFRIKGSVIVVLERSELEAVASGDHLAAALERKFMMMSLYGRHELVPPEDLRPSGVAVRRGAAAIRKAVNDSRRVVIDEVLERSEPAPPDAASGTDAINAALDEVVRAVEVAAENDDTLQAGPRAALIALARLCIAQLAVIDPILHGAGAGAIRSNVMTHIPDRLHVPLASRLWRVLTAHFADELRSDRQSDALGAALTIAGLASEAIAAIDDYLPEPPDWH